MTYETALRLTDWEAWSRLTEGGKVEVLQAIEDQAASESGRLSRPVVSEALYVGNDGVELGCYRHDQQTIYVNAYQLGEGSLYGDNPDSASSLYRTWSVPYKAGTITAKAYTDESRQTEITDTEGRREVSTTGEEAETISP